MPYVKADRTMVGKILSAAPEPGSPGTLLANMREKEGKYGVESMCIGGGMGAAALFELCD